ncbi:calmodulin-like isoform X2 [Acanthaster planci]|uniref:Calmodulin-like isoform X2 n=1 Tax=Acanthaster planci TaxID=133434 RepID=A0A8B7ZL53_ACAPL|nr:calmodulin-like isoform X2 [Acanthaster planci]
MSDAFSQEQFSEFKAAFSIFDKDGDGTVTSDELAVVLRSIGLNPTKRELDMIIKEADTDGNNMIELNEFLATMTQKMMQEGRGQDDDVMTEQEIKKTYDVFDSNGNGYISAADIRRVGTLYGECITDEGANQMIGEADTDSDGRVTYEDFLKMMTSP